ncbi:MAG: UMP kinase [Erysipelotrichaceae bacterium]|jgi:uridylate kinase|nr:UMP kinase [Erysipelotrichaceae bacterium]
MYKRILLKLSGEALSAPDFPFSTDVLEKIALQVKEIREMGVDVGIVIGGGNICRGRIFEKLGFDRVKADYAGMLATVINAVMFSAELNKVGVDSVAMSAIKAQNVMDFDVEEANRLMNEGKVLVFGGGYGLPYYSTDTGSAQRALDIHADVIMMAKMGVDGVYDSDPDDNPDAKRFDELTFNDILTLDLKVIDASAAQLCNDGKVEAFVFNMEEEGNIVKAVKGEAVGTRIRF